jgi:hypothetical protein
LLATQSNINQIKSDLLCLLLTNPGERVMLPTFGTPLRQLVFEQNDSILVQTATDMISTAIKTWEPRVTIEQININVGADNINLNSSDLQQDLEHILSIQIVFFDPENIKSLQSLTLEVPLATQGA